MGEIKTTYHEVIDWTEHQIHSRLGELALNKAEMTPRMMARAEVEVNCLVFELECRESTDGRIIVPATA